MLGSDVMLNAALAGAGQEFFRDGLIWSNFVLDWPRSRWPLAFADGWSNKSAFPIVSTVVGVSSLMSKRAYFGTDGIRGQANRHPMTAEVALRVGMAAGKLFRSGGDRRHLVVIGKDTRLSGYMIEPALVAGFTSVGMDVRI